MTALTQRMENINAINERVEKVNEITTEPIGDSLLEDDTLRYAIGAKGRRYDIDDWLDNHSNDPSTRVSHHM